MVRFVPILKSLSQYLQKAKPRMRCTHHFALLPVLHHAGGKNSTALFKEKSPNAKHPVSFPLRHLLGAPLAFAISICSFSVVAPTLPTGLPGEVGIPLLNIFNEVLENCVGFEWGLSSKDFLGRELIGFIVFCMSSFNIFQNFKLL